MTWWTFRGFVDITGRAAIWVSQPSWSYGHFAAYATTIRHPYLTITLVPIQSNVAGMIHWIGYIGEKQDIATATTICLETGGGGDLEDLGGGGGGFKMVVQI